MADLIATSNGQILDGTDDSDILDTGRFSDVTLNGSDGDDVLDATAGGGTNTLNGDGGNDELLAGSNDLLNGGAGNDILDAAAGSGGNTLDGGTGDDTLVAGTNDTLQGGDGNDRLFAGPDGGGSSFDGGAGFDQIWLTQADVPPDNNPNRVFNFVPGEDRLAFAGISELASSFEDLELVATDGGDTEIRIAESGELLGILDEFTGELAPINVFFADAVVGQGNPPAIADAVFALDLSGVENGTVIGALDVSEPDGQALIFSFPSGNADTDGDGEAAFAVDGLARLVVNDIDDLPAGNADLTVRATDTEGLFAEAQVQVATSGLIAADVEFELPENSAVDTVVGTVSAVDAEGDDLSFTITGGNDSGAFAIAGNGQITVADSAPLDFETTPSFTLTVSVTGGDDTDEATVTIDLTDVNEAPAIAPAGPFDLPENSPTGTVVGTVSADDPEGDDLSFAITAGNEDGIFAIADSGQITVADSAPLDFEAGTDSFTLTVSVSDGEFSDETDVTVNLTDVNEPPSFDQDIFNFVVVAVGGADGVADGDTVGTVSFSDPDGDDLALTITGGNTGGAFAIADDGVVTVADVAQLTESFTLEVTATEQGTDEAFTTTASVVIPVDLVDVDDPPEITNDGDTFTIFDTAEVDTLVGTVQVTDSDSETVSFALDEDSNPDTDGDGTPAFAIAPGTSNPDTGSFLGNITVADPDDLVADSTLNLGVTVTDDTGLTDTAEFAIDVQAGVAPFTLDVDGNGEAAAFTDGLIIFRSLAGLSPVTFESALAVDATRSADEIDSLLTNAAADGFLDADGNGDTQPFTDGLVIFRFLAGLAPETFTGALAPDATRTVDEVNAFLEGLLPLPGAAPAELGDLADTSLL